MTGGYRRAVALAVAMAFLLAAGCSGGDDGGPATTVATTPPSTLPATTTTVEGNPRPTTTISGALGPGGARLTGIVKAAEGVIAGATVKVERLVAGDRPDAQAMTLVQSGPGGQWAADAINGGRYRLRAWRVPDLVELEPVLLFLGATETKMVDLTVTRYGEGGVTAVFNPKAPVAGQPATLVLSVVDGVVDANGVLQARPRAGVQVQLAATGGLTVESPQLVTTDASGNAPYTVRCAPPGPMAATATVNGAARALELPMCGAPR